MKGQSQGEITWNRAKLTQLKKEWAAANAARKTEFYFRDEGRPMLLDTDYAKYLIEYLDGRLDLE